MIWAHTNMETTGRLPPLQAPRPNVQLTVLLNLLYPYLCVLGDNEPPETVVVPILATCPAGRRVHVRPGVQAQVGGELHVVTEFVTVKPTATPL